MSYVAIGLAAGNLIVGGIGAAKANKTKKKAEADERRRRVEMNRLKKAYSNLDTSNPYLNMENTMEDLTINQKQADFQIQNFQRSQANILDTLKSSSGGSGVAALAQSLAQQGQIGAQQASASIGAQEAANQRLTAREAARLQDKERAGEVKSRDWKRDQVGTMLGMSQQEVAAARDQANMAEQAKWDSIQGGMQGATSSITSGMTSGNFQGSSSTSSSGGLSTTDEQHEEIEAVGGTQPM